MASRMCSKIRRGDEMNDSEKFKKLQEAYNKCALNMFEEIERRERANCQCKFCRIQRGEIEAEP